MTREQVIKDVIDRVSDYNIREVIIDINPSSVNEELVKDIKDIVGKSGDMTNLDVSNEGKVIITFN